MKPERRANLSEKMKKRWEDCETIAQKLGLTKFQVFNASLPQETIESILNNNKEAIAQLKKSINKHEHSTKVADAVLNIVQYVQSCDEIMRLLEAIRVAAQNTEEYRKRM